MPFYTANKSSVRENNKRNYVGDLIRDFDRTYLRLMCCFFYFRTIRSWNVRKGVSVRMCGRKREIKDGRIGKRVSERELEQRERKREKDFCRFFHDLFALRRLLNQCNKT